MTTDREDRFVDYAGTGKHVVGSEWGDIIVSNRGDRHYEKDFWEFRFEADELLWRTAGSPGFSTFEKDKTVLEPSPEETTEADRIVKIAAGQAPTRLRDLIAQALANGREDCALKCMAVKEGKFSKVENAYQCTEDLCADVIRGYVPPSQ